ncbi:MAG: hypothetical protein IKP73_17015 [Bacteroidales bacterium]|nr:hypothetical protein [Bacteroidales bacterium]
MKAFLTIILLTFAMSGVCQREYTYENKGINLFLEADGNANLDFALGGPALTIGYQFNPHLFVGAGVSHKFGGERGLIRTETRTLGWYDATDGSFHDDYYIDQNGERHRIIDNPNYDGFHYYDDCDEGCCDGGVFVDIFFDMRYNFLAHSRYTPYIGLKSGAFFGEYGASDLSEVLLGCRFACGEGDFAIVGGTGWTYRHLHKDYGELNKNQHLFTIRLGVEF